MNLIEMNGPVDESHQWLIDELKQGTTPRPGIYLQFDYAFAAVCLHN